MDGFEKELKLGFLEEATQAIADVEMSFLQLENDSGNKEHINNIFRLAHNLKGSSKAVGFDQFGYFTHEFESFVLRVKNGELQVKSDVISVLLEAADYIKSMISVLKENPSASINVSQQIERLKSFSQSEEEADTTSVLKVNEISESKRNTLQQVSSADESIRVTLSKVEKLLNTVGELVIIHSVLAQQAEKAGQADLSKLVQQMGKVTKEIQDTSMGLRMVPIKSTFQKMQRIVRDTAQLLHKDVRFTLSGDETEVDKSVLEHINDPLVHLVRNAVDHGIEDAETRASRGKNRQAAVELKAYHRAGRLVIEVCDDGGGLDTDRIRQIALDKGIIQTTTVLTEQEAMKLIFAPGFSTKEQVTEVSGRGVGLDVVKTNIEKLGGEIQIDSIPEKGTSMRVVLPLTLAIIDGLVVASNNQRYVIPLSHVHETLSPEPAQVFYEKNVGRLLMLRDENLPLYYLSEFFGLKPLVEDKPIAIVFRNNGKAFAILVDEIMTQQQVVVKKLSGAMLNQKGLSGSTILGDGKPSLILEPADLLGRPIKKFEKMINTNSHTEKDKVA